MNGKEPRPSNRPSWDTLPDSPFQRALTGDLECQSCDYGPCIHKANKKAEVALGMPTTCLYGQEIYADFTARFKAVKGGSKHE